MAGGMDLGTSKGGKKPLDAQINLVPFIDLMAVMISFLIMTAVWTQIGRLQVSQSGGPSNDEQKEDTKTVPVTLLITDKALCPSPRMRVIQTSSDMESRTLLICQTHNASKPVTMVPDDRTP